MFTPEALARELRSLIATSEFDAELSTEGQTYDTLAQFDSGLALVCFLDHAERYSPKRDAVVADLMRLRRATASPRVLNAVLYAVLPGLCRAFRRAQSTAWRRDADARQELWAEVVDAAYQRVLAFVPDARSCHVLAGVQRDVFNAIDRGRHYERRRHTAVENIASLIDIALAASEHLTMGACFPDFDRQVDSALDDHEIQLGEAAIRRLVDQGVVTESDRYLISGLRLHRKTSSSLGRELGVDRRTVVRRAERALEAVRQRLREEILGPDARFGADLPKER